MTGLCRSILSARFSDNKYVHQWCKTLSLQKQIIVLANIYIIRSGFINPKCVRFTFKKKKKKENWEICSHRSEKQKNLQKASWKFPAIGYKCWIMKIKYKVDIFSIPESVFWEDDISSIFMHNQNAVSWIVSSLVFVSPGKLFTTCKMHLKWYVWKYELLTVKFGKAALVI